MIVDMFSDTLNDFELSKLEAYLVVLLLAFSVILSINVRIRIMGEKILLAIIFSDDLTGCKNRKALMDFDFNYFEGYFLYIDVDNFAAINNQFGHSTGDLVLKNIVEILTKQFGEQVYRIGGDEFCVICDNNKSQLIEVLEQIYSDLNNSTDSFMPTLSVGIVSAHQVDKKSIDAFISLADAAMYTSKHSGKNTYTFQ